ncbi:unnamed protein product [Brassica rapa subsp. narinosa]
MSPNMRSIFAQVRRKSDHGIIFILYISLFVRLGLDWTQVRRKSVPMGSTRNFCSSSTHSEESQKIAIVTFVVTRTLGFASGYLIGHYLIGDLDKLYEERMQEDLRKAKRMEELLANVAKLSKK